jgi:hypothetical protein
MFNKKPPHVMWYLGMQWYYLNIMNTSQHMFWVKCFHNTERKGSAEIAGALAPHLHLNYRVVKNSASNDTSAKFVLADQLPVTLSQLDTTRCQVLAINWSYTLINPLTVGLHSIKCSQLVH